MMSIDCINSDTAARSSDSAASAPTGPLGKVQAISVQAVRSVRDPIGSKLLGHVNFHRALVQL
jgi:hypothetical protein